MDLRYLTPEQSKALSILAFQVAMADGTVTGPEEELMAEIREQLGVTDEVTPQELMERPSLDVFDTPRARVTALLQLLILAFVDSRFPVSESEVIVQMADEFGLDAMGLGRFQDQARHNVDLKYSFERLVADLGG